MEETAVTEAVSQLQLEQSKEFDPLEQSQVQVSQSHIESPYCVLTKLLQQESPEKARQLSKERIH